MLYAHMYITYALVIYGVDDNNYIQKQLHDVRVLFQHAAREKFRFNWSTCAGAGARQVGLCLHWQLSVFQLKAGKMSTHLGLSDGTSSYSEPESRNRYFFPNMPVSEIYLCSLVAKRRKQRELPRAQSHSILYSGITGPCRKLRSFYIKTA